MATSETLQKILTGEIPTDFNWNRDRSSEVPLPRRIPSEPTARQAASTIIVSEDLRDGLHGVKEHPSVKGMSEYVGVLKRFGIDTMITGIFSGEGKINNSIQVLLARMRDEHPEVTPIVLLQAQKEAIDWGIACKQINPKLNGLIFMGTAPYRMMVQYWTRDFVLGRMTESIERATKEGIDVIGATEHTTQTPPDFLKQIIKAQVESGIKVFCAADTIGTARPVGTYRLIRSIRDYLDELGHPEILIDWHGHRDTGNDTQNAMTAIAAGANRIHTVAGGIGERAGNTPLEAVVINLATILKENGRKVPWNMKELSHVIDTYRKLVNVPHPQHGMLAERAFATSLGIHTDGILKAIELANEAEKAGHKQLAAQLRDMSRTLYSSVDPQAIGRDMDAHVGHWSGVKSVRLAHLYYGGDTVLTEQKEQHILAVAKGLGRELTTDELVKLFKNGNS